MKKLVQKGFTLIESDDRRRDHRHPCGDRDPNFIKFQARSKQSEATGISRPSSTRRGLLPGEDPFSR